MKPGLYQVTDFIPPATVKERRQREDWHFLNFAGSDNEFLCEGVTIELDTALRKALNPPIHTDEFVLSGSRITLRGLTIRCTGDGISMGGALLGVTGKENTISGCTLHVQGSAPYGYGDLFGKGGHKHSGMHITGDGTRLRGCRVFMQSFGHGCYIQEDAADVSIEDCHVEGVMRWSDEMLAETRGMAFDRQFRTEMQMRGGEHRILPGYRKALAEDGFRTYGQHRNLTIRNCTAKHMRGGFELRTKTAPVVENCTATGCERGFWVADGATVTGCRADARYGPALYVQGDKANVSLELLPDTDPKATVHAVAAICGSGNRVTLTAKSDHTSPAPILLGYNPPGAGENMAQHGEFKAFQTTLRNETAMPVAISAKASEATLTTRGPVQQNAGKKIVITPL